MKRLERAGTVLESIGRRRCARRHHAERIGKCRQGSLEPIAVLRSTPTGETSGHRSATSHRAGLMTAHRAAMVASPREEKCGDSRGRGPAFGYHRRTEQGRRNGHARVMQEIRRSAESKSEGRAAGRAGGDDSLSSSCCRVVSKSCLLPPELWRTDPDPKTIPSAYNRRDIGQRTV